MLYLLRRKGAKLMSSATFPELQVRIKAFTADQL
jgi:hypothetical protein